MALHGSIALLRIVGLHRAGLGSHVLKLAAVGLAIIAADQLIACREPPHRSATATAPPKPPPPAPPPLFQAQDSALALQTLRHAPDHGFPTTRFPVDEIDQRLASSMDADRAEGQRLLRLAVIDYARAQHGLTIPLGALPAAWNQRPTRYDATAELDAALRAGTLGAWLDTLPPQTPAYRALQTAYVAAISGRSDHVRRFIRTASLTVGDQNDSVTALRKRLAPESPALDGVDAEAPVDEDLIDALRAYQTHHHLEETGVLDTVTVAQMNAPILNQAARLRVNMERLRWLPRPEPSRRIDVNIAAAELSYIRDGAVAAHMLAVSGKIGDETPIVSSEINSIVLDPPWYVPTDIAQREILPKGAAYMEARHFVWRGGRLIQLAGPKSALGLVKFDFPNPYAVYLHDTPSKASFNLAQRTASHGCMRLQRAVELAKILAAEEPGLSAERVDTILASGKTVRLKLTRPVPVRLMYFTAEPKGDTIAYLPDVYGWDPVLLALLDRYSTSRRQLRIRDRDTPEPSRLASVEAR